MLLTEGILWMDLFPLKVTSVGTQHMLEWMPCKTHERKKFFLNERWFPGWYNLVSFCYCGVAVWLRIWPFNFVYWGHWSSLIIFFLFLEHRHSRLQWTYAFNVISKKWWGKWGITLKESVVHSFLGAVLNLFFWKLVRVTFFSLLVVVKYCVSKTLEMMKQLTWYSKERPAPLKRYLKVVWVCSWTRWCIIVLSEKWRWNEGWVLFSELGSVADELVERWSICIICYFTADASCVFCL